MNILYVENHLVFAENVKRQFLSRHLVTVVPSLSAARQMMQEKPFDLMLVDYDLDDGKGDELVRALRISSSSAIIIAVSSHAEGNIALMKAGASAICSKMEFEQIQIVIDRVTQSSHQNTRTA